MANGRGLIEAYMEQQDSLGVSLVGHLPRLLAVASLKQNNSSFYLSHRFSAANGHGLIEANITPTFQPAYFTICRSLIKGKEGSP